MTTTQLRIKELTDSLIESVTGITRQNDAENFTICRNYAQGKFKTHNFGRTNQFEVNDRLAGLEEKFFINDANDLAEALHSRLEELPSTPLMPEMLHLLLELSDRPLENSRVSDLDALVPPEKQRELTWADIVAQDPLEGEIWEDVDFGAESSDAWSDDDDEDLWGDRLSPGRKRQRRGRVSVTIPAADEEEDFRVKGVEGFIVKPDKGGLETLKKTQYWDLRIEAKVEDVDVSMASCGVENLWAISELQSLREVVFMLLGYPCALFQRPPGEGRDPDAVEVDEDTSRQFALRHASYGSFLSILNWFAERGTLLNRTRSFVRRRERLPERQSFIAALEERLGELDRELIRIEKRYLGAGSSQKVSLLSLQSLLSGILQPFCHLAVIIGSLVESPVNTHSHLEALFQSACYLQSTGDIESFTFMASLFFSCLRAYLRPIRAWMESGTLFSDDFLVVQCKSTVDIASAPGKLWQSGYALRRTPSGALTAPIFVRTAANRIFVTGKSVVFLKRLQNSAVTEDDYIPSTAADADDLTLSAVCPATDSLAPFSDLFAAAFNQWIAERHHSVSSRLRNLLFKSCGLSRSLDALTYVFLARNGFVFETLAAALFDKIDRRVMGWHDRFLLTELVQGVFASTACIDADRLRMSAAAPSSRPEEGRSVKALAKIDIDYILPWPVQNILIPEHLAVYKSVFTLLLQLRRARNVLERLQLLKLRDASPVYYNLRQKLLWFANVLHSYITTLVIVPQTERFRTELEDATDVDAMVQCHAAYTDRLREMCLLGAKLAPIAIAVTSVCDLAVRFTDAVVVDLVGESGLATAHLDKRGRRGDESSGGRTSPTFSTTTTRKEDDDEGSSDSDSDSDDEEPKDLPTVIAGMEGEFRALVGFVRDGLRGVARAGVMPWLEWLAEGLEGGGVWER